MPRPYPFFEDEKDPEEEYSSPYAHPAGQEPEEEVDPYLAWQQEMGIDQSQPEGEEDETGKREPDRELGEAKKEEQEETISGRDQEALVGEVEAGEAAEKGEKKEQTLAVNFPFGMLILAGFFDLIGLIPFLNIITETFAGLLFGMWQKSYAPKTNPVITFVVAKFIDVASLGILPSNTGIVVYTFIKKKSGLS